MAIKLRIRTANFTAINVGTGEEVDEGTLIAAITPQIKQALTDALYNTKGMRIKEDTLSFDIGRGRNTSIYDLKRPEEIELTVEGS